MPITEINRLPVHYQSAGHGPELVMIHGLFSNLAFWYMNIVPLLVRDFRAVVYDLRGHGYSGSPASGYTSAHMAADLHNLLDHLGIKRAHLIGHSFGGTVALHYAVLHPERVRSLTLADARIPCLQPPLLPRSAPQWKRLNAQLKQAGIEVPENLPRVTYSLFEDLAHLRHSQRAQGSAEDNGLTNFLGAWKGSSRAMQRWNRLMRTTTAHRDLEDPAGLTVEQIRKVNQPTLAIFGRRSGCLPTLRGLQQSIPNCRSVLVSGAGHFHPVFKPETFVKHVEEFIGEVETAERPSLITGSR